MISMDQTGTKGVFGGVTITKGAEGFTRGATDAKLKEIVFKTNEMGAYIPVSNKLLRNAPMLGAFCQDRLRAAITNVEEHDFLLGSGVGECTGIINHPAALNVNRATASTITYPDIINMLAKSLMDGGQYVWMASQTILPQLMAMVSGAALPILIWQPSAREGAPDMLLGKPLYFNTHCPVLGSQGDLQLVCWKKYGIKDGQVMTIFINPYLNSRTQQTDIQINYSVDGQPWLTSPVILEDATTYISPFVCLK
jgi:HK97 family phage major capsid protein